MFVYEGSLRLSVAASSIRVAQLLVVKIPTFEMEQHVGLVVLEHLSYELHVHVLDVDLLVASQSSFHPILGHFIPEGSCSAGQ